MVKNKVERISLMGGLLGLLFTNPRKALDDCISYHNTQGWRAIIIVHHSERNLFVIVIQVVVLIFTFGLWTWNAGYLVMFERYDGPHNSVDKRDELRIEK